MLAKAIEVSENAKLGLLSTTYSGRTSCPKTCPLKAAGACYGDNGNTHWQWNKLENRGTPRQVALEEAAAIDGLSGQLDLRLHTVGDCATTEAVLIVAAACERFIQRGLENYGRAPKAFTYSHAWRTVPYKAWGKISVLASCETIGDVKAAKALGYPAALMVKEFPSDKAYAIDGVRVLPCPQQLGKASNCASCRLCMNASKLNVVIGLKIHGPTRRAKAMLESLTTK